MRATGLLAFIGETNIFADEDHALVDISMRFGEDAKDDALFCLLPHRDS
jgi:hypothetical protein